MDLPQSSVDEMKYKTYALPNHRKCIVVGAGESGYLAHALLPRLVPRMRGHVAWLTAQPVHRMRLAQCLYATGFYTKLDMERPLLQLDWAGDFVFEEVSEVDPRSNALALLDGRRLSYDYLLLCPGRSVHPAQRRAAEQSAREDNDLYCLASREALDKLRDRLEFLHEGMEFCFLLMRGERPAELISLALLLRENFPRAAMRFFLEGEALYGPAGPEEELRRLLAERRVELVLGARVVSTDEAPFLTVNGQSPSFLAFAPTTQPSTAFTTALSPEEFDETTLTHRRFPNVFAAGSFLFPQAGLAEKHAQVCAAGRSLHRRLEAEWFGRTVPIEPYVPRLRDALLTGRRSVALAEAAGLQRGRVLSWRLLNWDFLRYFNLPPLSRRGGRFFC